MAGLFKNALSYFALDDPADEVVEEQRETVKAQPQQSFDEDHSVAPHMQTSPTSSTLSVKSSSGKAKQFPGKLNRITTLHPKTYEEAQQVGRAIRDGIPVVLNLEGVDDKIAYRIIDFSGGVIFGVRGKIDRITPRVFLLLPAQVDLVAEEGTADVDLFTK